MRKMTAIFATTALVATLGACGKTAETPAPAPETAPETTAETEAPAATETATEETAEAPADTAEVSADGVMSYADFVAAPVDSKVTVETYIQDKQGWWENEGVGMATFYTQDNDGGYFLYNMPCSKDDYDVMGGGTKIRVTGYKAEWSGEIEITDIESYEIIYDDMFVANAEDLTDIIGDDDALAAKMNKYVAFNGLKVADRDGNAFTYGWDGSKSQGDDIYFNLEDADGKVHTFVVESYLRGADTDTYKAVEALKVGDTVDVEGFLYWYEGPQVHVTYVTVK